MRAWRRADRAGEAALERARHEARSLTLFPDEDGSWVVRGRLDPEVGAVLKIALEAAADALLRRARDRAVEGHDGEGVPEEPTSHVQRMADAVGLVAERALAFEGDVRRADRFQVVLHVDAEGLAAEDGCPSGGDVRPRGIDTARRRGEARDPVPPTGPGGGAGQSVLEASGHRVPAETARRLACDASVFRMVHGREGRVLDVGRCTRAVPASIRRVPEHRDRTCRFPGCTVRHTDAHHMTHWADGGETKLDNLVLSCRSHHRAVHEGAIRLERVGGEGLPPVPGRIRFRRPDGGLVPVAPRPPSLPDDPTAALVRAHRERGIAPDGSTTTSGWWGERLDLGMAVDAFRRLGRADDGGREAPFP